MSVEETPGRTQRPDPTADFLAGYDFMRLGQSVNSGRWDSAMMIWRRLDQSVKSLGITALEQPLRSLRAAIVGRNSMQAKQSLSMLVAVRVRLLKQLGSKTES